MIALNSQGSDFSLRVGGAALVAQVALPAPPATAAAQLAAAFVKSAYAASAPAIGLGLAGAAATSAAEYIIGLLSGQIPPGISQREIQMASVAMRQLGVTANDLSRLGPEQKAFFVKSAAAAVDGRGAAPDSTYLAALRLILQKAGQLSGSQIARINPAEADRMFGLRPQEAPPNLPIRSSFPSANSPRAGDGVLVNPGAPDMQFPRHTGSGRRTENLSPPHMEAERPKLRGERGGSGQPQPLGSTLSADDIRRIASGLVSGHAFDKHFHEFQDLGITTPEQLHAHVSNVLANMGLTSQTKVVDGKRLVYDPDSNTILIFHSQTGNAVTMFRPENGARYYYDMGKKK